MNSIELLTMEDRAKKHRRNSSPQNAYTGKAGHLAVMAELAWRGYNVALPEIDKGDDIFAVDDRNGNLWRIQVKTAKRQKNQYQVAVDERQIKRRTDRHFVFALRVDNTGQGASHWRFVVMSRAKLKEYIDNSESCDKSFGSLAGGENRRLLSITLNSKQKKGEVTCARAIWTSHMEDWSEWPIIDHTQTPSPSDSEEAQT